MYASLHRCRCAAEAAPAEAPCGNFAASTGAHRLQSAHAFRGNRSQLPPGTPVAHVHSVSSEARTVPPDPELPEHREVSIAARLRGQRVLTAAALVVIVFGLRFAEAFLVPVIIGVMVAAVSSPLVNWFSKRGAPTVLSAAIVLLLDIAVLGGMARLLLLAASDLQGGLPSYVAKFSALSVSLQQYLQRQGLHNFAAAHWLSTDQASTMVQSFIGDFATGASHVALVVFVVFFLLCELGGMGEKLRRLSANADVQFERVDRIVRQVQLYLVVKLWTSLLAGVGAFLVLRAVGVELALLLSLSMFILHFIPNVGAAIATIPAVIFALVDRGPAAAATVGIAFIVINTVVGSLVEPRMLGTRLGVSPFVVLLGMLFWGWLWGPAGALLSVPILAATKIVLENIPDLAWISELVDPRTEHHAPAGLASGGIPHERVGLGLGAHSRRRRSARVTIPGFPLKQLKQRSAPAPKVTLPAPTGNKS
jgi:AI-2 transport protein TqsA